VSQHVLVVVVPPGEPFIRAQVATVCGSGGISMSPITGAFPRHLDGRVVGARLGVLVAGAFF
jgi:hypothetical protein